MTTDKELSMDNQAATAAFAAKGIDITQEKDQGVLKVVKRQGQEGDRPMIGDKVTIHYTSKLLNGKRFDSSLDRKEPICFNLGRGRVLKAWDMAISTMQRGEVCLLLCKPEYAYGSAGNPPKIPPNSSILFEIELLNFEGEVLTDDGGIIRRIKVKGELFNNPNEGATVEVHLEGSCQGRVFDSRDVTFVVGEADDKGVPLGVDRAMEKMQKGECCLLYLKSKYGFGTEGKPEYKIGPNAEVVYKVTLKDFKKSKESWEMDLTEKLDMAAGIKRKGNYYFKAGRYLQAIIQYQRIVSWLEMECGSGPEQQQRTRSLLVLTQLNLALCFLRLSEFSQAVDNCNKVIEMDEQNEKALYRRGEARLLRNEFSLALADFRQVLQVNATNRAARTQISTCQRKIREHNERDKHIYANMFQRFAEHDAKVGRSKRRSDERTDENCQLGTRKRRRSSQERP